MSTIELRKHIKKAVDKLSDARLASVADYVDFVSRPSLPERVKKAEEDIRAGRGTDGRKVRDDV